MKTKLQSVMFSLMLATGLLASLPTARAQDEGQKPKKERRENGPGDRLEMMKQRLSLTDEQVEQLKPILAAEREELMAKRKELGKDADRETMREAAKAIHDKYQPKIAAVLTPEQLEKLAQMREQGPGGKGGKGGEGKKGKGGGERPPGGPDA